MRCCPICDHLAADMVDGLIDDVASEQHIDFGADLDQPGSACGQEVGGRHDGTVVVYDCSHGVAISEKETSSVVTCNPGTPSYPRRTSLSDAQNGRNWNPVAA